MTIVTELADRNRCSVSAEADRGQRLLSSPTGRGIGCDLPLRGADQIGQGFRAGERGADLIRQGPVGRHRERVVSPWR